MKRKHYEINPGTNGQLYVTLVAANGEKIAAGEGYRDVRDARNVIRIIKSMGPGTPVQDNSPSNPESPSP